MASTSSAPLNPILEALLADPLTRAMMAADGIEIAEMRALLQAAWTSAQARDVVPPDAGRIDAAERYSRK